MKAIFKNRTIWIASCVILVLAMAAGGYWQLYNPVSIKASGLVSIDVNRETPGAEVISERTENGKKFFLGPDAYALDVSMQAIHYKDNYADRQEQWKDIDLTFKDGRITKAPYILTVDQANKSFTVQDKKSGQVTTLSLAKIGEQSIEAIEKQPATVSVGKIQWDNVATDLDLAVTAENTRVRFDWIVKSEKAPHEVQFEFKDGGIPISYEGTDAEGNPVQVATAKTGDSVTETIEKGGKYPKVINPTLDLQLGNGNDDASVYYNGSAWSISLADNNAMVGYFLNSYKKAGIGLRWTGITIPGTATITTAYVSVYDGNGDSATTINTKITGDKENNPATFSTIADYQTRRGTIVGGANNTKITSAQVNWDNIPAWSSGTWHNSPEINTIIQELIGNHAPSNEAIALFWDDHDDRTTHTNYTIRTIRSYNISPSNSAKLHIEYTSGPSISNTPSSYNMDEVGPSSTIPTGLNFFTVTNNSASSVNVTIGGTDLTGGITWTLSDTAAPGTNTAGLKAGLNGGSYNVVVKKNSPFNILKSGLAAGASQSWGFQLLAPTNYTDAAQKSGTITLTATAP